MPTYERTPEFLKDLAQLTPAQRKQFEAAVRALIEDLKANRPFRAGLRIQRFHTASHPSRVRLISSG